METPKKTHPIKVSGVPSWAGLILLDCLKRPLYYSPEAIRILSYPRYPTTPDRLIDFLPKEIRSWLSGFATHSDSPRITEFMSGKRHCLCRAFTLVPSFGKPATAITALLIERSTPKAAKISEIATLFRLSQREQEAVALLTLGLTNKEIASQMKVAPDTVKTFFRLVRGKMAVNSRSGIVGKIALV